MKVNLTKSKCSCCKTPMNPSNLVTSRTSETGVAHMCGCGQIDDLTSKEVKK